MITNRQIIRAIDDTLADWAKLDSEHRGPLYEDAVEDLKNWKSTLEGDLSGEKRA